MSFLDLLQVQSSYKLTENGALASSSSGNDIVDMFAEAGALRNRDENDIEIMFGKAMLADPALATKLAFYTRDVRGGLGERRTGRIMFRYLVQNYPDIFAKNAALIPEYGRWDDIVWLYDYAPAVTGEIIFNQFCQDCNNKENNKPISLLAKWLPSVNTSSRQTVMKAKKFAKMFGGDDKTYRKSLADLRRYLDVVEVKMSDRQFDKIQYSAVPSNAMNKYRNAFIRNDGENFKMYLENVATGKEKINASVLYPYNIVEKYFYDTGYFCRGFKADKTLELQWKNLPNYIEGENRFLVMADVSGSMYGRPLATSVGLAIYFAERNKGAFANKFMTFSAKPQLVEIKGRTLAEKIGLVSKSKWMMNTDLEAAFNLVLKTAIRNKVAATDMPTSIVVITDMEIDSCENGNKLFYDEMKEKYEKYGYQMPNVVFWNVNARNNTYHACYNRKGVQLASGQSVNVFKSLLNGENLSAYQYMLSVLNDERYDKITI